jgi:Chlamydia polymorphic membrane protein (Chlamydia_PMP) repeat
VSAMPRSVSTRARAVRRCLIAGFPALFFAGSALSLVQPASSASAAGVITLYAYAGRGAIGPTTCPRTTTGSRECTLAEALSKSVAGSTIALATPGRKGHYVGNWTVSTLAFSPSAPLTIEPALGVADPTLDGNHGKATGCQTKICNGPVLTIASGVHVDIDGITIQDADNAGHGGAIDNPGGGTVIVSASTFYGNTAGDGGAIDNGDKGGGVLNVSASMFSHNTATSDGGAIDNGDRGSGAVTVSASTFSGNTATSDGGAIDNADRGSAGLTISGSTFWGNRATDGGAIDNADRGGAGLAISASTFSGNTATSDGGAIDNADHTGTSTVWVAADIFNGSCDRPAGTWNDEGYNVGINETCLNAGSGDVGQDANELGPLANNGGPTKTMLALRGNPALGIIPLGTTVTLNGKAVTLCPTVDQRGVKSPSGQHCNAGAVQP